MLSMLSACHFAGQPGHLSLGRQSCYTLVRSLSCSWLLLPHVVLLPAGPCRPSVRLTYSMVKRKGKCGYQSKWTSGKSHVDGVAIREKARSIYDHLAEKELLDPPLPPGLCQSAMGGFPRFKQRLACPHIARTGGSRDELAFLYKKMGNRTYIHQGGDEVRSYQDSRHFKDRLTVLFVGCLRGTCKITPLLVYPLPPHVL
ncbi:hypothetical protein GWK47_055186 [Chionoecetes opilio]|uniref:Uncharacterized protein n=1 Tax=Chionoecetes opilio TaxID=41210 RepID=A0A8J4XXS8_CHIOP|nr:hypothetical protein GWK47_055186 [Chionoecetes opilio]